MSAAWIKGMDLCNQFYADVVAPLMKTHYPGVQHSAGRLGGGSDVLGFDTPQSRDHDWGPQVDIFLTQTDYEHIGREIYETLATLLPLQYKGYSTHFVDDYLMGPATSPRSPRRKASMKHAGGSRPL